MKNKHRQSGLSLIEQVMVVASVAAIMYFALPAAKQLFNNLETPAGTETLLALLWLLPVLWQPKISGMSASAFNMLITKMNL